MELFAWPAVKPAATEPVMQAGFTLIELIVVIVILGVLAAFALPRFVKLQSDARASVAEQLYGSIQSADSLVYRKALVTGVAGAPTASVPIGQGITVDTIYGYPDASSNGIGQALQDTGGLLTLYALSPGGTATFRVNGATNADACQVTYTPPGSASAAPVVSKATSGC